MEGSRLPAPRLLECELFEVLRIEKPEAGREDETDDGKDVSQGGPAFDVGFASVFTGRKLGGAGAGLVVSPARSTRVLRFNPLAGGGIAIFRALVAAADISKSFLGERILLGGRMPEVNCALCQLPAMPSKE